MKTPHKHAAIIKAWADGAVIEHRVKANGTWGAWNVSEFNNPRWWADPCYEYRVKPEPKPDYVMRTSLHVNLAWQHGTPPPVWSDVKYYSCLGDFEVLMDGETGNVKSVKVLK
jgi:hypothetical protein